MLQLWVVASMSFAFGWGVRSLLRGDPMSVPSNFKRIVLDWGACHRLLDELQISCEQLDLLPRVRLLVDYLAATAGWPAGKPEQSTYGLPKLVGKPIRKRGKKQRKRRSTKHSN